MACKTIVKFWTVDRKKAVQSLAIHRSPSVRVLGFKGAEAAVACPVVAHRIDHLRLARIDRSCGRVHASLKHNCTKLPDLQIL